jgi:glycosyltransferase involved in cell wall biosynthesis
MRILLIAPLWETVPPPAYGGTEAVVSLLSDGLTLAGHDVTLFASGDSTTKGNLEWVYHRSLRTADDTEIIDPCPYEWLHNAIALSQAEEFDIVHNHGGELAMAMSHLIKTPMLTTLHGHVTPNSKIIWDHYDWFYNAISYAQRKYLPIIASRNFIGVVYNAIQVETFPYHEDKEDYLLFLARISPEKGAHYAIEVAKRLGKKLLIAGKVDRVDKEYFSKEVEPLVDGKQIQFLGEADAEQKRALYAKAYCLLMPITWEEPFGLNMIEAMACGTPVIAFSRGAAPELIVQGKTGYLVSNVDEMVKAVYLVDQIEPHCCREHVERNFDNPRMIKGYLDAYERVLNRSEAIPKRYHIFNIPVHEVFQNNKSYK